MRNAFQCEILFNASISQHSITEDAMRDKVSAAILAGLAAQQGCWTAMLAHLSSAAAQSGEHGYSSC